MKWMWRSLRSLYNQGTNFLGKVLNWAFWFMLAPVVIVQKKGTLSRKQKLQSGLRVGSAIALASHVKKWYYMYHVIFSVITLLDTICECNFIYIYHVCVSVRNTLHTESYMLCNIIRINSLASFCMHLQKHFPQNASLKQGEPGAYT